MNEPEHDPIICRSHKSNGCYNGRTMVSVYGNEFKDEDWRDDGTYDPDTGTIVCDPCYMAIGQPGIDINHPDAPTFGRSIDQGDPRDE